MARGHAGPEHNLRLEPANLQWRSSQQGSAHDVLLLQIHCEKVTTGSVRRGINCLCFSADGAWLFAGTASGDILTINVARKAVQVCWCCCAGCVVERARAV